LWITTRSGRAYRFVDGAWSNQNKALGKKPGVIGAMADDQAGNIWFAFSDKVVQWDGSAYHRFVRKARDVSETTMSVRGDHIWLGGPGGVQLFTQGRFYTMKWKAQNLPGRVSGVVETEAGDLWVNGFSGIAHVSAAELRKWLREPDSAVSAERLDELDGLPGRSGEKIPEPSVVEASDGRLWFATTKGIAWLDPAALERNRNRVPPPVVVSAVISSGKRYPGARGLTLPAMTENLEIDYSALSLAIPERVLFRYKLDGVDTGWQNVGTRRQAYYTKLGPGQYTFRVMACNNDGVWNEAGALMSLTLSPAWFQRTWFRLLCVVCGVVMASLLYRIRVRQIAAGINARFEERLAERNLVAQELHDTLLQGFLSASMQVHVAKDRLPEDSPVKPALTRSLELMGQVIEEGRMALRGIRSTAVVALDLEDAFAQIQQEFTPGSTNEKPAEFRLIVEGRQKPLNPLLRDEIYRIGREALTNAFRHARASHVEIELQHGSRDFRLLVSDDGCGVDPHTLHAGQNGHRGLSGMRERAERMGARLHLFSSPSAGTEVYLSVPGFIAYQDRPPGRRSWLRSGRQPSQTSSFSL
jgi:signal transduction histidine kinase